MQKDMIIDKAIFLLHPNLIMSIQQLAMLEQEPEYD